MRDESVCVSTIAATALTAALIPMQSAHSRATFRSREPTFVGRRADSPTVKVLTAGEPTRHRSRPEAPGTGVRPYERTNFPRRQQEPTNWLHGLPDGHHHGAFWPALHESLHIKRRWPNRASGPLRAIFLMPPRSPGAIGRVRAAPGALPTAGRSTDGPDARVDGSPARERG